MQVNAPKFNASNIKEYPKKLQIQCWDVISKFLVGPRPTHLNPELLKRIGATNAKTLNDICTQLGYETSSLSAESLNQAKCYSDKYIGEIASSSDITNLAIISDSICKLTGYYLKEHLTESIPQKGIDKFIKLLKDNPHIQGTCNYDGYGYWVLENNYWKMYKIDEYNQINL